MRMLSCVVLLLAAATAGSNDSRAQNDTTTWADRMKRGTSERGVARSGQYISAPHTENPWACQSECAFNPRCRGWSFTAEFRICALLSSVTGRSGRADATSGDMPDPAPPRPANARASTLRSRTAFHTGGVRISPDKIVNTATAEQCMQLCIEDRRCAAWQHLGPLARCDLYSETPLSFGPDPYFATGEIYLPGARKPVRTSAIRPNTAWQQPSTQSKITQKHADNAQQCLDACLGVAPCVAWERLDWGLCVLLRAVPAGTTTKEGGATGVVTRR